LIPPGSLETSNADYEVTGLPKLQKQMMRDYFIAGKQKL